jgi:hypothetical protein
VKDKSGGVGGCEPTHRYETEMNGVPKWRQCWGRTVARRAISQPVTVRPSRGWGTRFFFGVPGLYPVLVAAAQDGEPCEREDDGADDADG